MKTKVPSGGLLSALILVSAISMLCPRPSASQEFQREIDRIAEEISTTAAKAELKNVAVLDFTDLQGNVQELGRFMAEELTISLVLKERPFKTIDRANLRNILLENKLSATGLINPENAKKLKISGVDGLIRGTLTPYGESIRLTIQIIAVETAEIVGAARGIVPKTSAMDNLGEAIDSVSQPDPGQSSAGPSSSRKGLSFQNNSLRITLTYFRKDSGNAIKAIFLIENLTKTTLYLNWNSPQLVDDQGEQWRLAERSGIARDSYSGTAISEGTNITALLVFKPEGAASKSIKFNVLGPITVKDERGQDKTPLYPNIHNVPLGI